MTLRIVVLGCGDVGSAVARRLFLQGANVVLADVEAPAHPRRGMAFADAWFDGTATLEGVVAQLVPELNGLASTLEDMDAIAGTPVKTARSRSRRPGTTEVLRDVPASALAGEPRPLGGAGRERFVYAAESGAWRTNARIGDRAVSGALVGTLCGRPVYAPLSGVLRGLTRDGVTVRAAQKLVEVDPGEQAQKDKTRMNTGVQAGFEAW